MKRRLTLCILLGALAAATASAGDFKQEALNRINTLEKKYTGLAGAMPQDSYKWRPAEGVRSVSELLLHVAGANYGLTRFIGTAPPEGMDLRGMQKSTTDKAAIAPKLAGSFAHLKGAVQKMDLGSADEAVKMFGGETTQRGAVLNILEHLSEHLGQAIAYARVNNVVPPWTAARGN